MEMSPAESGAAAHEFTADNFDAVKVTIRCPTSANTSPSRKTANTAGILPHTTDKWSASGTKTPRDTSARALGSAPAVMAQWHSFKDLVHSVKDFARRGVRNQGEVAAAAGCCRLRRFLLESFQRESGFIDSRGKERPGRSFWY